MLSRAKNWTLQLETGEWRPCLVAPCSYTTEHYRLQQDSVNLPVGVASLRILVARYQHWALRYDTATTHSCICLRQFQLQLSAHSTRSSACCEYACSTTKRKALSTLATTVSEFGDKLYAAQTLAWTLINSRLSYCNSLLYRASGRHQGCKAFMLAASRCDDKPFLHQLHRLQAHPI